MNIKTTIILVAILGLLGVIALFMGGKDDEQAIKPPEDVKLLSLNSTEVNKLTVSGPNNQRLVLEKSGPDWRMLEPVSAPADTWAVDALVRAATDLKSRGEIPAKDSAGFGLDSPRYTLELSTSTGKSATVNVGSRALTGGNLYVKLPKENKQYAVGTELADQLEKPFTSYRQTKLVTASATDIKQISIQRGDEKLSLQKIGEDWQITEPKKMPGDSSEVSNLTFSLTGLTATEFAASVPPLLDPAKNPTMTAWYSTAAPTTQPSTQPTTQPAGTTITFGGYDTVLKKNVYVSVNQPPTLAKVSAFSMESLQKKPLDLRDRKVVNIDPALVSRIAITTESPATTQPTTKPASKTELLIQRRKTDLTLGPAAPPAPATKPTTLPATTQSTTAPATQATTAPSTAPAPSPWIIVSKDNADANEAKVTELLEKFKPLRAQKFLEPSSATTQPTAAYTIQITTEAAGQSTQHQLRLTDPGDSKPLIATHNDLAFELDRAFLQSLTTDFTTAPMDVSSMDKLNLGGNLKFE